MGKYKDLTGLTFGDGRLKVLRKAPSNHRVQWVCRCACGNICVVRGDHLKSGAIKSCGCIPRGKPAGEMQVKEIKSGSGSRDALITNDGVPYQNLANAIIAVAADDYRRALKKGDSKLKRSLEAFFSSDWYKTLTSVGGEWLMDALQLEHAGNLRKVNM